MPKQPSGEFPKEARSEFKAKAIRTRRVLLGAWHITATRNYRGID
jgi:hypothetical protein